eukprot:TRINITY_DN25416_c0_g1_i1.p1 TRINITY_DN25416_c0_g1~~TRINITY_DN25416_c0_g1_i1.p1  ORF type:complete len:242 (-),score=4.72 TRINITY_DN25416_c0_g1_i1:160-885(-)
MSGSLYLARSTADRSPRHFSPRHFSPRRSPYESLAESKEHHHAMHNKSILYLMGAMVAAGKARPEEVQAKLCALWATLGVVSALILSLVPFREPAKCELKNGWLDCGRLPVNEVHVLCNGLSMLGCIVSVLVSTLMYAMMSLLPQDAVAAFVKDFNRCLSIPTHGLKLGLVFWLVDNLWEALFKHGPAAVLPVAAVFALCLGSIFILYWVMWDYVKEKLCACLQSSDPGWSSDWSSHPENV